LGDFWVIFPQQTNEMFANHHRRTNTESHYTEIVPGAGLEPARLAAADFESAASAISPPGRTIRNLLLTKKRCVNSSDQRTRPKPGIGRDIVPTIRRVQPLGFFFTNR
jgi:hypothetical protein